LTTAASHCSALDDSLALVLALMLDVSREEIAAQSGEEPSRKPPPPAVGEPGESAIRVPKGAPAPRAPWRVAVGAHAQAAVGNLPATAFGAGLDVVVGPPLPILVALEIGAWLPQTLRAPEGATAQIRSGSAAIFLCRPWGRTVSWALCFGQRLALTDTKAAGFDQNENPQSVAYSLGIRGQFAIRWGAVEWVAGLTLDAPTSRGQFYYARGDGTSGRLFQTAPVVGTATVGLTVDL
jgi:hypothetical protein